MKIYHLSHTDLDGYGAQFVAAHYLTDVEFFNANYGKEINEKFELILERIDERLAADADEKIPGVFFGLVALRHEDNV